MNTAVLILVSALSVALSSCSTTGQNNAAALGQRVTNLDGTGKKLPASAMEQIVMRGVRASSLSTSWCTLDPLPNPLPPNFMETVPTPYPLPNTPATSELNQLWRDENAPKRTWCFVKNEPEPTFYQCTTDPTRRCVDGDYFVINPKSDGGFTWINFTNQHSGKVRLVRLVWEP